jgi:hypothetical protein
MSVRLFSLGLGLAAATLCAPAVAATLAEGAHRDRGAAVAFCKKAVFDTQRWSTAIVLNDSKSVVCFSGEISLTYRDRDMAKLRDLKQGGIFVVRSPGGTVAHAMTIGNLLRDKGASVVAYEFCLSACADFVLLATDTAHVVRDTLVAAHYGRERLPTICGDFAAAYGNGACPKSRLFNNPAGAAFSKYFETRIASQTTFSGQAQSGYVRTAIRAMSLTDKKAAEAVWWTLGPDYLSTTFKTKVSYDAYYRDQAEVDRLAQKLRMGRVIYDP